MISMNWDDLLQKAIGKSPYNYQKKVFEEVWTELSQNGGLKVIEAPTASGKTEAVVIPFLRQFMEKDFRLAPRMVYVLPTHSLIHFQKERILKLISHLNIQDKIPEDAVRVDHGLSHIPTPMFFGRIILTTWDSFLYALAAQRTIGDRLTLPAGNIASSYIIFDEVQMYQDWTAYVPHLMGYILKMLQATGTSVVVMSATLPTKLKELLGLHQKPVEPENEDLRNFSRGKVEISAQSCSIEEFLQKNSNLIQETITKGEKVLIVVNRVARAQSLYNLLQKGDNDILLLHSRFVAKDREEREKRLHSKDRNFTILIATQVVEAGLDLSSVTLGLMDLAPPDALFQRIGRIARRKEEEGKVYLFPPQSNDEMDLTPYIPFSHLLEEVKTDPGFQWLSGNAELLKMYYSKLLQDTSSLREILQLPAPESTRKWLDKFYNDFHFLLKEDIDGQKETADESR